MSNFEKNRLSAHIKALNLIKDDIDDVIHRIGDIKMNQTAWTEIGVYVYSALDQIHSVQSILDAVLDEPKDDIDREARDYYTK